MGFVRNTLRAKDPDNDRFKCDLIVGVASGWDLVATTRPYYRSSWAMVVPSGKGLDGLREPDDLLKIDHKILHSLHFGLIARSPPTDWLLQNGLIDQAIPYVPQSGDPNAYPGELIEKELPSGHVDVAFAWGPIAGYYVKRSNGTQHLVSFPASDKIHYDFQISMGVRQQDKAWLQRLDEFIARNQGRINEVLASFGVPLLDGEGKPLAASVP
jgi:ABC-type amino acid transport substrate-binding protein